MYWPCTRPRTGRIGPCRRPCTCRVHGPCRRTCTRLCMGRVHDRVHGALRPCTRPTAATCRLGPCTRPCRPTCHVHDCVLAVYKDVYMARTRPFNCGCRHARVGRLCNTYACVHGCVHGRVRSVSDRVDGRVQGRGPCTRLVRRVLLRFSLQKTPFMPKRTDTNPLHSKRASTTSAPSAALQRTTVLRTMLIIR